MTVEDRPTWREKHQEVHIEWWSNHPEELQYLGDRDREYVELIAGIEQDPDKGYIPARRMGYTRVARLFGRSSRQMKEHFLLLANVAARRKREAELAAQTTATAIDDQPNDSSL